MLSYIINKYISYSYLIKVFLKRLLTVIHSTSMLFSVLSFSTSAKELNDTNEKAKHNYTHRYLTTGGMEKLIDGHIEKGYIIDMINCMQLNCE